MHDTEDFLATTLDEVIGRATKRMSEDKLVVASLPAAKQMEHRRELRRRQGSIDRLVKLREAMMFDEPRGSPLRAIAIANMRGTLPAQKG
jgi:hypothetical protein